MTPEKITTAMVLAAGRGQRMQPLTSVLPKPALPLPDGPVVTSALRLAAAAGATRIVVNASHLANRLVEAIATVDIDDVEIVLSIEEELMGTAGGLALARDRGLLGDHGSVLVVNGDGALGLDLQSFLDRHFARRDLVTLALLPHLDPQRWSRIVLDANECVRAILPPGEPGPVEESFLYPGVMAVCRDSLNELRAIPGDVPLELWRPARRVGGLGGVVIAGYWREVGTPSDYLEVMRARLAGSTWRDPSAKVSAGASITDSFIGRGVEVCEGATVENSILAEGSIIEENSRLSHSIILGQLRIPANELIEGQYLVGDSESA